MHFAKLKGEPLPVTGGGEKDGEGDVEMGERGVKRALENGDGEEDIEAKRRRVLEETRDIDADSEEEEDSSEDDRLVNFPYSFVLLGVQVLSTVGFC